MSLLLLFNQPAAGAYTLTAAGGVYSYSGNNATLTYTTSGAFSLAADGGVYSYTGNNAIFRVNRVLTADGGTYTYVGNNADLIYSGGPPPPPVAADIYFIELRSFTERRRI
jgi:hypothetical protein